MLLVALAAVPFCSGCKGDGPAGPVTPVVEPVTLSIVDKDATPETKALYANLWAIREKAGSLAIRTTS